MVSSAGANNSANNSSRGFAYMGLVFKIRDDSSRGHVRKYALIALAETDQMLMRDWTYLTDYFNRIRTWMVKSPETAAAAAAAASAAASAAAAATSGGGNPAVAATGTALHEDDVESEGSSSYTSPPSLFLRTRNSKAQSKSLPELLKNDTFFEELHAKFTQILSTLDKKYSGSSFLNN